MSNETTEYKNSPVITVLMSVYNAQNDLKESVESILKQSFKDFKFIIINDGSGDGSLAVLEGYARNDPHIRIISHENKGLTKSLNVGIQEARGRYIARQDADDVSYPDRFEKQLALFNSNDSLVLVGGNCDDVYEDGSTGIWGYSTPEELHKIVFFKTPFAHSTVMMRTDVCRALGGYDERYKTSQDMEFWMRFAEKGTLAMVETPILLRRIVRGSISTRRRWRQFYDALRARWVHNAGSDRLRALYIAVRGLVIGLLPPAFIRFLKDRRP